MCGCSLGPHKISQVVITPQDAALEKPLGDGYRWGNHLVVGNSQVVRQRRRGRGLRVSLFFYVPFLFVYLMMRERRGRPPCEQEGVACLA